ncbi:MAG: 5-oxoprolinase subunit PxpA [Chitinophagaceae bacterium]
MPVIDLNCDMGEGYPSDEALMPYISSANIACGYHAGDFDTMKRTIDLCMRHGVAIGAHPSYPDKENFGRIDLLGGKITLRNLPPIIETQIGLLQRMCEKAGTKLHHVKPHGALYNRAAIDRFASDVICRSIFSLNPSLVLYGLSGSEMETAAQQSGLQFKREVFADRTYQDNGTLRPRSMRDALITDREKSLAQVLQMIQQGEVTTFDSKVIPMKAETICIHGDGAHAVEFARTISEELKRNGITISYKL